MALNLACERHVLAIAIGTMALAGTLGCTRSVAPADQSTEALAAKLSTLDSQAQQLVVDELDKFCPGREQNELLADIRWRGDFGMTAICDAQVVTTIGYEVLPAEKSEFGGIWVWAVFTDGKFLKFVEPPAALPEDVQTVDYRGTPWSRPKPLKAGDNRGLLRTLASDAKNIDAIRRDAESLEKREPPPESVDPGLTAAFLLLRVIGAIPDCSDLPSDADPLRNAELRDQYNAMRLRVGMTVEEVETILQARPIETGDVELGAYRIYGSVESFDVDECEHFRNILVIYQNGEAVAIEGIPAGYEWRKRLWEVTSDLPYAPKKE